MSDRAKRRAERAAATGDPEAARRAALEVCRAEGHRGNLSTYPDPEDPTRLVEVWFCYRCAAVEAKLKDPHHEEELFKGPRGLITAASSTGRIHVVNVVPPWRFPVPPKRMVSYWERYRYRTDMRGPVSVGALCPARVDIPPKHTDLAEAMRLATLPVTCQHCSKMIKDYHPNEEIVSGGLSLANIVTARTHYILRYSKSKVSRPPGFEEDITPCIDCGHAIHLYSDCAEDGCPCKWSCSEDASNRYVLDDVLTVGALNYCRDCNISIPQTHILCAGCVSERNNPYV